MRIKRIVCFIILLCLHISIFAFPISLKGEESFKIYSYEEVSESIGYITLSSKGEVKHASTSFIVSKDEQYSYVVASFVTSSSGYDRKLHFGETTLDIILVGKDETVDVAVFKFETKEYDAPALKFADSSTLKVGQQIFFAGLAGFSSTDTNNNPTDPIYSKEQTFVSKTDVLYCPNYYLHDCSVLMFLDAELNKYTQGGPIFNNYGYVVGMVTTNNPNEKDEDGEDLYHAIFSSDLNIFLNRILDKNYQRADIGIYFERIEDMNCNRLDYLKAHDFKTGTVVTGLKNNAVLSGLGIDYIITKINGKEVKTTIDLIRELYRYEESTIIRVTARKTNGDYQTYYVKG